MQKQGGWRNSWRSKHIIPHEKQNPLLIAFRLRWNYTRITAAMEILKSKAGRNCQNCYALRKLPNFISLLILKHEGQQNSTKHRPSKGIR
jgi:hypothetical protein